MITEINSGIFRIVRLFCVAHIFRIVHTFRIARLFRTAHICRIVRFVRKARGDISERKCFAVKLCYACVTRKVTVSVPPSAISGKLTLKSPPE